MVGTGYFGWVDTDLGRGLLDRASIRRQVSGDPRFLRTPMPLSQAIDAIERGVDRRAARLWAPRWIGIMLGLRGVLQQLLEVGARRDPGPTVEAARMAGPEGDAAGPHVDPVLGVAVQDGTPFTELDAAKEHPTDDGA